MIAQKLEQIADNMQSVYEACHNRHYAAVIRGSGTSELTFTLPFEPDVIEICCNDPDIRATCGIVAYAQLDLAALGQLTGIFCMTAGPVGSGNLGSYTNALSAAAKLPERYRRSEDGTVTIGNLPYNSTFGVWDSSLEYMVTAAKCVTRSDKERITQIIERLPEGQTHKIHIQKAKKDGAFTDEQWNELIAAQSTYTFVMT